jgi:phenylpropionate dioxygenase-like ring-hydroxylating dioxygenase large terminal subunit
LNSTRQDKPGAARAPGPTVAATLRSDRQPAEPPLLEQSYEFLGDAQIPAARYTSRAFFQREVDHLWPRAWQWACREEHLQEVGDNYVVDIGPWSIIAVRSAANTIQAFVNSCRHRGTRILAAEGSGYGDGFTCPFHGWSWHADGRLRSLPARWDFPHVDERRHALQPVRCETWGGFVFINMDPSAQPLADYLDVLPEHFNHFPLDRRRITCHVEKLLPANWKAAQEAFMEAYHNFETHDSPNGANAQYDIFGQYVTRFIHNIGRYSPEALADYPRDKWRNPQVSEAEQLGHLNPGDGQPGPADRAEAAQLLRQKLGDQYGVDLSQCSDSLMLDSIEYHLFPNMFFFPGISIPMAYRFRPNGDDVDSCIFDLLLLAPMADGEQHPEPPTPVRLTVEQSYTEVAALKWLGPVYDEDTGNLLAQQQGLKNCGDVMAPANYQVVAKASDIPTRQTACVTLAGREILLCHTADGFFAVDNICSHAGEQLNKGRLKGHRIFCPLHGAAFDVRDGSALSRPASLPLRTYPLRLDGDDILLAIDEQTTME